MIEATPADLLGRCVRGAAKPLALFLSDALSCCIGTNYVGVSNRILGRDGKNQKTPNLPVESLLSLDLPSLLHLFDNCLFLKPGPDYHGENEWKQEFRLLFRIPKGSESSHGYAKALGIEIAAVRAARNDLSHLEAGTEVAVMDIKSDLHKLLDLFAKRCAIVVRSNSNVFSVDTRSALSAYIAEIERSLQELDREMVERALKSEREEQDRVKGVANRDRTKNLRNAVLITGLVTIVALALTLGGVFTQTPKNSIGIVLLDTVPTARLDEVVDLIQNHAGATDRVQIAYLKSNGREVTTVDADNEPSGLRIVAASLNDPGPVVNRFEYRTRFDALYEHLQAAVSREQAPILIILGSIGNFTNEELEKLKHGEMDLYPHKGMSAWWVSNRVAPPTFVYWQTPTKSDSALFVNFPDKSGEMKPVVEVLR